MAGYSDLAACHTRSRFIPVLTHKSIVDIEDITSTGYAEDTEFIAMVERRRIEWFVVKET